MQILRATPQLASASSRTPAPRPSTTPFLGTPTLPPPSSPPASKASTSFPPTRTSSVPILNSSISSAGSSACARAFSQSGTPTTTSSSTAPRPSTYSPSMPLQRQTPSSFPYSASSSPSRVSPN